MEAYGQYWGNRAKQLLILAAVLLFFSIFSTEVTSWVSYNQNGQRVHQDFVTVAGALGQPWVYLVPLSALAIFLGLFFVWDVEGREGMVWRKRWIPIVVALVILVVALAVVVVVGWMLDKEMTRRGLSFWNNAGGGWYLALTGATLGLFSIIFGAIVSRWPKGTPGPGPHLQAETPPPPPDQQMGYVAQQPAQQQQQQQSWPEYPAYGAQAQAAPPPPPSQYDQNYIPPQPPEQAPSPFDSGAGGQAAPAPKPKKKWFGK
jgi:hypothetical protein